MGTTRRVTDAQVKELRRQLNQGASLRKAAMKTDMDRKSARKYRALGKLPSETRKPHTWRTRPDPLVEVWPEVEALLAKEPQLLAKTIWEWLQQTHPRKYPASIRRTLERRVRQWKAQHGPDKEIFFAQEHAPGRLAASDFTSMNDLGVTLAGVPFDHLLYHFVLTYSNWEHVTVCPSESFASLSTGLQNALWVLDAAPERHRTDRTTLAVHHDGQAAEFTANYQALLAHYGVAAEATNPYSGHENGDVESAHGHFKKAVAQALLLRGSRDFPGPEPYEQWLRALAAARNASRASKLAAELACMRRLPAARLETLERIRVRVSRMSTIRVKHNTYSVPARLRGEEVEARIGMAEIEVWYRQQLVQRMARLRGQDKHRIDYRHVIGWLVRKPGAFARYVYREDLYPTVTFRRAYDALVAEQPGSADKEYLQLLRLASASGEGPVEAILAERLRQGQPLTALAVETSLGKPAPATQAAVVAVAAVDLRSYDLLFEASATAAGWTWLAEADRATTTAAADGDERVVDKKDCESRLNVSKRNKEDGHEHGELTGPAEGPRGVKPADDAGAMRGGGPPGDRRILELCDLPSGISGPGVPATPTEAHRALAEGLEAASGEELANPGPQAFAAQGGTAVTQSAERRLPGSTGECTAFWTPRIRKDPRALCGVAGTGPRRSPRTVHQVWFVSPGTVGSQARPAFAGDDQAAGAVGSLIHRRPGLCAAESRGDGSVVHALGRALRARQRAGDQQSAVLEVGTDLQGCDDRSRRHRPPGASQCHCGDERVQLPHGESEEGQDRAASIRGAWEHWLARGRSGGEVTPTWGPGSAPEAVAALRLPERSLDPTPPRIASIRWGKIIVAKGER